VQCATDRFSLVACRSVLRIVTGRLFVLFAVCLLRRLSGSQLSLISSLRSGRLGGIARLLRFAIGERLFVLRQGSVMRSHCLSILGHLRFILSVGFGVGHAVAGSSGGQRDLQFLGRALGGCRLARLSSIAAFSLLSIAGPMAMAEKLDRLS